MKVLYEPLTKGDLDRIHGATVRLLERTGFKVLEDEAVRMLVDAGCSFDKKSRIVKMPEKVLKDCLATAPSKVSLYSRDGKRVLALGEGNVYFSSVGTPVKVEGLDGVVRHSTAKDAENFFRLEDALSNIDHASWACWPRDLPEAVAHMYLTYMAFKHTNKTTDGYNWGKRYSRQSLEVAAMVAGGKEELEKKPMLMGFVNPVSPLTLSKELTEGAIEFARAGQPVVFPPECMAGGTSPATLAGLLVQQNAEVLSAMCVSQLARRGAPVLYSSVSGLMEMRTGSILLGAPEVGLIMGATAQLARYYKVPCRGTGGNTESMLADYQAGSESMNTLLLAAMAGIDFIYDAAGSIESSVTASYTKMVLDNDICGYVRRILQGIRTDEEALAAEVIEAFGHKGSYLGAPHTLKHYKTESVRPDMFWRGIRDAWESKKDLRDLRERARRRASEIISEHEPAVPLDPEVDRRILDYIKREQKRAG